MGGRASPHSTTTVWRLFGCCLRLGGAGGVVVGVGVGAVTGAVAPSEKDDDDPAVTDGDDDDDDDVVMTAGDGATDEDGGVGGVMCWAGRKI